MDKMQAPRDRFGRWWQPAAAGLLMQMRQACAIRSDNRVTEALTVRAGLDQHRTGAVAEQHASGAVCVIDDRRHLVGADNHDLARMTGTDELRGDGERVYET